MTQSTTRSREDASSWIAAAKPAIEAGDYAGAERLLRAVLADDPSSAEARYLLGLACYRMGRFGEAVATFRALLDDHPDDHRIMYSLGIALEKHGDLAGAREGLSHSLVAKPDFAEAREKLESLSARSGSAGSVEDSGGGTTTLAALLEDRTDAASHGNLLSSGRRRISSMAGRFVVGGIFAAVGSMLALNPSTRPSAGLARLTMLGRTPAFYRARLEEIRDPGLPGDRSAPRFTASVEADLARAVSDLFDRTRVIDELLEGTGFILLSIGALIVAWSALAAVLTRYEIFTHRIDITRGVVQRQTDTIWLYEINDVVYQQPWWLLLTGNARIAVTTDSRRHHIVGFGTAAMTRRRWSEIRDGALSERRAMRRWWI